MKVLFKSLILAIFLCYCGAVYSQLNDDYVVYFSGDTVFGKIYQVKPGKLKIKTDGKKKWLKSNEVRCARDILYFYESFYFNRQQRFKFLIRNYAGELNVYSEFDQVKHSSHNSGLFSPTSWGPGIWMGGTNGVFTTRRVRFYKPYFRHVSENNKIIHPVSIAELKNKTYYNCDSVMKSLIAGLNEFDLDWTIRNETFRDLIKKYDMNCEAEQRWK